ncbi:MAG: ParB N-terminal domain-containing protein [Proteobacteria bacterium]|nr:ParB N-terminal domain-containing protein [Pseudomonadota bacterium]MBU4294802.1 ParB N-terminal domain-containing protein [Pseudomonadota bacterium]MCG2748080.1 ParB N-terminal domain-containing protein [Desulfobulbaceae bacterium]
MHISRININHIDFDDDSFSLVPPFIASQTPASLVESIRRCGILHPPVVKEKSASSFTIVAGRKRLLAAIEATGAATYDCHKLTEKTEAIDILAICLEDALLSRPLTPVERAVFCKKALALIDENELASRFLPLMGLTQSVYHIQRDLRLLELEEPLLIAMHEGFLDDKVALELGKFSFSDRVALFEVINTLHLSVGNQKKLAITCRELAARNNTTISALLHSPEVDSIINHGEANSPQKTSNLMKWLTCERFPRLSQAEKEFQHFIAGLALPDQARVEHSPSFEKDELVLTLSCANRKDFLAIWQQIRDHFPPAQERKTTP